VLLGYALCPVAPRRHEADPDAVFRRACDTMSISPSEAARILNGHTLLIEGRDSIAGRPCWVLRMKPDVKGRPWKQLWIDTASNQVLAMRRWTGCNELASSLKTPTSGRPLTRRAVFPH